MSPTPLQVSRCDPASPAHAEALVRLLDAYARDPMGGGEGLSASVQAELVPRLAARSDWVGLIAWREGEPLGLLNAFEGFSTFRAAPLMNIHDVAVLPTARRLGVASALFAAIEAEARTRGCCKLTLEVLSGNAVALALYATQGFAAYQLDPAAGQALFLQKWLEPVA